MNDFGTVTVYTQVYNTKPYLEQCINSVLSQTYSNLEYILVDNGCTDGSSEILEGFAKKDARIHLIRFAENQQGCWRRLIREYSTGTYFTLIDSDDWWEANYLERLVSIAHKKGLDIVCTGSVMHYMATGQLGLRQVERNLFLTKKQFPEALPLYHQFFRTTWGKLVRMEVFEAVPPESCPVMVYGGDTFHCFQLLRKSQSIEIDHATLYHYRVHSKSVSYQYDPKRFETDICLYNDAVDFLTSFGPISARNRQFLQIVYANAVSDTLRVIAGSNISPADKLREYYSIAIHPLTRATYRECTDVSIGQSRMLLLNLSIQAMAGLGGADDTHFQTIMQTLLSRCGPAMTGRNIRFIAQDPALLQPLLEDDAENLLRHLLKLIKKNQCIKKYNLIGMIQALAADNPFLCQITDIAFLRQYPELFLTVWSGQYRYALEEMAGLLLDEQVDRGKETFLNLFLSLAAELGQAPAFIVGKLRLAELFLRQNRIAECREAVSDLKDMGMSNTKELLELQQALQASGE